jgi:hypothetical protein
MNVGRLKGNIRLEANPRARVTPDHSAFARMALEGAMDGANAACANLAAGSQSRIVWTCSKPSAESECHYLFEPRVQQPSSPSNRPSERGRESSAYNIDTFRSPCVLGPPRLGVRAGRNFILHSPRCASSDARNPCCSPSLHVET